MKKQDRLMYIVDQFVNPEEWPSLRALSAYWDKNTLTIDFYFNEEITDVLKENASVLATEILAQFFDGFLEEKYIYLPYPLPLPEISSWVYKNSRLNAA
jgi:hypothetical protein